MDTTKRQHFFAKLTEIDASSRTAHCLLFTDIHSIGVDETKSAVATELSGVQQDSPIVPLPFLIYINDLIGKHKQFTTGFGHNDEMVRALGLAKH